RNTPVEYHISALYLPDQRAPPKFAPSRAFVKENVPARGVRPRAIRVHVQIEPDFTIVLSQVQNPLLRRQGGNAGVPASEAERVTDRLEADVITHDDSD
ncbi:MAG: hypothetical protein NT154_19775, partial [Verrucomicrobia bacterium]|nr:hypothetical protein [Verrucomicrobiota bacterium]